MKLGLDLKLDDWRCLGWQNLWFSAGSKQVVDALSVRLLIIDELFELVWGKLFGYGVVAQRCSKVEQLNRLKV